jgi:hypothetical protein
MDHSTVSPTANAWRLLVSSSLISEVRQLFQIYLTH